MIGRLFALGIEGLRRRFGLAMLVWGANLAVALAISVPAITALNSIVGPSGFGDDLARSFDLVLWSDILDRTSLDGLLHFVWIIPTYMIWKSLLAAGLLHALAGSGTGSFVQGIRRFWARSLAIGLVFLPVAVLGVVGAVLSGVLLSAVWTGEVARFWIGVVVIPTLIFCILAAVILLRDVARGVLVVQEQPVWTAVAAGFMRPFQRGAIAAVYGAWLLVTASTIALWPVVEMHVAQSAVTLFLSLQALLFCRAAATVAWHASLAAVCDEPSVPHVGEGN